MEEEIDEFIAKVMKEKICEPEGYKEAIENALYNESLIKREKKKKEIQILIISSIIGFAIIIVTLCVFL